MKRIFCKKILKFHNLQGNINYNNDQENPKAKEDKLKLKY
jgi:hypothetical protein